MDGPNVNWSFYEKIEDKLFHDYNSSLINIGSCGLHVMHNAFKSGATVSGWISDYLGSLYYLFKDSPARKEDYLRFSQTSLMPLIFVSHRCLENIPVCTRALEIHENILNYVKAVNEKKVSKPTCKSYSTVCEAIQDKLLLSKLHFFRSVANHLQSFLTIYQTDKPMVFFLGQDLDEVIRSLMRRYIKGEVLSEADNFEKLKTVQNEKKNSLSYKTVDIGVTIEKHLKEVTGSISCSEREVLEFRIQSKDFMSAVVTKLLVKCPLSYSLVRYLSCLNPREMLANPDTCRKRFRKVVSLLLSKKLIKEDDCDTVIQQYATFLDKIPCTASHQFEHFNQKDENHRVDELFMSRCDEITMSNLKDVFRMLLVLSHGQVQVERGFSVNKEVEVENMTEEALKAERLICDQVKACGGVLNVPITKPLLASAAMARKRYDMYREKQREIKKTEQEKRKRKHELESLGELKNKKKRLNLDIESLTKSAHEMAEKAEATGKLTFISKSNGTQKEKSQKVKEIEGKINEKLDIKKKC